MSTSEMRWVITQDLIADCPPTRVGVGNFPVENAIQLPYEFQLLDDDKNIYYRGRCDNPGNFDESEAFQPLDFATADAGAIEMQYRAGTDHKWETL